MTRPTTLPPAWAALAEALGGVGKLAEACGVDRTTIQNWGAGMRPAPLVQKAVNMMARRRKLREVFADCNVPSCGEPATRYDHEGKPICAECMQVLVEGETMTPDEQLAKWDAGGYAKKKGSK